MSDELFPWTVYRDGELIDVYTDAEVAEAFRIFGPDHHVAADFTTGILRIDEVR